MRCRACDYSLWNLRTRKCPECGEAYFPSEYEFVANAVCFCCPHCDQAYYGTDAKGHLSPRAFECVGCAKRVSMDEMVLRPAEGVRDSHTEVEKIPWGEAKGTGYFGAWFQTVWRAMIAPHRLLTSRARERATARAWGFALVTGAVVTIGAFLPYFLFGFVMAGIFAAGGGGGRGGAGILVVVGVIAAMLLGAVVANLVFVAMWGACAHLVLKWSGPMQESIGRTYQAICYSSGANIATAIPCLGFYFGWIWWVVSAAFMLRDAQRVSGLRATFAAAIFPVAFVVMVLGSYAMLIVNVGQMGTTYQTTQLGSVDAATSTTRLARSARHHALLYGGELPAHAAELIVAGQVEPLAFIVNESSTRPYAVPLGDSTLQQFMWMSYRERLQSVEKIVNTSPSNLVAHRLGDFVICWHGMNLNTADSELWIVIASMDPDFNQSEGINGYIHVGRADGTTEQIAVDDWDERLAEQNALRVARGLPPLPPPSSVRHGLPALEP